MGLIYIGKFEKIEKYIDSNDVFRVDIFQNEESGKFRIELSVKIPIDSWTCYEIGEFVKIKDAKMWINNNINEVSGVKMGLKVFNIN